jgi:hypothetical protein
MKMWRQKIWTLMAVSHHEPRLIAQKHWSSNKSAKITVMRMASRVYIRVTLKRTFERQKHKILTRSSPYE